MSLLSCVLSLHTKFAFTVRVLLITFYKISLFILIIINNMQLHLLKPGVLSSQSLYITEICISVIIYTRVYLQKSSEGKAVQLYSSQM